MRWPVFYLLLAASLGQPHLVYPRTDGMAGSAAAGITVSAAISLTNALQEVGRAYGTAGGGPVRFNFAASNVLARQIVNGAPVDVFISADEAQMDYTQKAGATDPASRVALLGNRLAIVVPSDRALVAGVHGLTDPHIRRVAIGDPSAVPVGVYAKQYLERLNLWNVLQPKLLPLSSARAALAAVASRVADAAIVYESDVATARVTLGAVIDDANAPQIVYPAAIVARSKNRSQASAFLSFLRGSEAGAIFRRFKFRYPPDRKAPDRRTQGPRDPRTHGPI